MMFFVMQTVGSAYPSAMNIEYIATNRRSLKCDYTPRSYLLRWLMVILLTNDSYIVNNNNNSKNKEIFRLHVFGK